jgi:hypothetical protein
MWSWHAMVRVALKVADMDDEGEVGFVQFRRTLRYFCSCTLALLWQIFERHGIPKSVFL